MLRYRLHSFWICLHHFQTGLQHGLRLFLTGSHFILKYLVSGFCLGFHPLLFGFHFFLIWDHCFLYSINFGHQECLSLFCWYMIECLEPNYSHNPIILNPVFQFLHPLPCDSMTVYWV
jgi:hypothetical protein